MVYEFSRRMNSGWIITGTLNLNAVVVHLDANEHIHLAIRAMNDSIDNGFEQRWLWIFRLCYELAVASEESEVSQLGFQKILESDD